MSALPPPCEQLKKSIVDMGAEVSLDGLRGYVVRHGNGLVHSAFDAYHRQLMNWWPETLLTRYNELPRKRGADDARRQCLVSYLPSLLSGPQQFCLLPLFVPQAPLAFSCPLSRLRRTAVGQKYLGRKACENQFSSRTC